MIRILLFAELEEEYGKREFDLQVNEITVKDIRRMLVEKNPELTKVHSAMVAVNEEYAEENVLVHEGDIVAFIPPVSGG